jgi:hypothetical protein
MNRHQQRRIDRLDKLVLDLMRRMDKLDGGGDQPPKKDKVRGPAGTAASRRQDVLKATAAAASATIGKKAE